jgi:hypothetical protein
MSQNNRYMTGRSIVELMFIPITIRNTNDTTEKNTIVVNIFSVCRNRFVLLYTCFIISCELLLEKIKKINAQWCAGLLVHESNQ